MQAKFSFEPLKSFDLDLSSPELESWRESWRSWFAAVKKPPLLFSFVRNGDGPISTVVGECFLCIDAETSDLRFASIHPDSIPAPCNGCRDQIALPDGRFLLNSDQGDSNSPRLWEPKVGRLSKPFYPEVVSCWGQSSSSLIVWATDRRVCVTDFATDETRQLFSSAEPFKKVFCPYHAYLVWLDTTHQAYCWHPRLERVIQAPELLESVSHYGGITRCTPLTKHDDLTGNIYWDLDENTIKSTQTFRRLNEPTDDVNEFDYRIRLEGQPSGRIWEDNLQEDPESWPRSFLETFLEGFAFGCTCIALGRDGTLAWGDSLGNVHRAFVDGDSTCTVIQKHESSLENVFIHQNGDVIGWCYANEVSRWSAQTQQAESMIVTRLWDEFFRIGYGPDETILFYRRDPNDAALMGALVTDIDANAFWQTSKDSLIPGWRFFDKMQPPSLRQLTNGLLVLGDWNGQVEVYDHYEFKKEDPERNLLRHSFLAHRDMVHHLTETLDGRLVTGSLDGQVKLWDHTFQTAVTLPDHDSPIVGIGVLPDGRIVSGSTRGRVVIWDAATDEKDIYDLPCQMTCFASRPNEFQIACGMMKQIIVFALRRK